MSLAQEGRETFYSIVGVLNCFISLVDRSCRLAELSLKFLGQWRPAYELYSAGQLQSSDV